MLIHDSAIGIKELKFELNTKKASTVLIRSREGEIWKYLAVAVAKTPPMNAHVPWPSDRAEATKNQSQRRERFLILQARKC